MVPSCLSTLAAENVRHSTRPRGSLCCLRRVWVPRPYLPTLSAYNLAVMVPFYQGLDRLPPLESEWKAKSSYGPVTSPSVPRFDQTGIFSYGFPFYVPPQHLLPGAPLIELTPRDLLTSHLPTIGISSWECPGRIPQQDSTQPSPHTPKSRTRISPDWS